MQPARLPPATAAVFATARRHHQAGHPRQAETLYRLVLSRCPGHAESWHSLGLLALLAEQPALAVEMIREAIGIDATVAPYHTSLGNALRAAGDPESALVCYQRAIALQPEHGAAYNNRGAVLQALGRLDEAEASLHQAVARHPDGPEALINLAHLLLTRGRTEAAHAWYRKAAERWPDDATAHNALGAALTDAGDPAAAEPCLRRAAALRPGFAAAHYNLGVALVRLRRLPEAASAFRLAIAHQPDLPAAHDALGSVLADLGRPDAAEACYRRALGLRADDPAVHNNLGTVLKATGRLDAAILSFRAAVALRPDFANARHNLGMALLARGDLAEGWEAYEWRNAGQSDFPQPKWRGEAGHGRTLLIHAEQGFGDSIQFCRFAAPAAARGWRVVMAVPKPLLRLLQGIDGVSEVIEDDGAWPAFDAHCPMQSLPRALGTTPATIPAAASGYLRAEPALVARWARRLDSERPLVGLVWAGNPAMVRDASRSIAPEHLEPLGKAADVAFVSLQHEAVARQFGGPADFAVTAALIANLDLVIAVDTAVAHLAAALGKPVWLLDRFDGDWRWLTGRCDSPWYPTLRIYRQPVPGDWTTVLAGVARDLTAWAAGQW